MKKIKIFLILLSSLSLSNFLDGQVFNSGGDNIPDIIYLKNPSFKGTPRAGSSLLLPIRGWSDCGRIYFTSESPPDIHPVPGGAWGVMGKAEDGKTYLGMVVRQNETWEMVSQKLTPGLYSGKCYSFKAYLSLSPVYLSRTKTTLDTLKNFSHPIVLCIWGGINECERTELLAQSPLVDNYEWKEFSFEFKPNNDIKWITLEAFYYLPDPNHVEDNWAYNGHIMVDHLSPITEIDCK